MMAGVIGLCVLPLLLNLFGLDFDLRVDAAAVAASDNLDGMLRLLAGTYVHTLLEWTATVLAFVAAVLAFAHFQMTRDVVTPIIGVALLTAGLVDAFHVLAADRLVESTADNREFIPFTWAISRTFNAIIPVTALALILFTKAYRPDSQPRQSLWTIGVGAALIAAVAYAIIHYCATSESLPQTLFPHALITRPWDIYPLVIYVVSGLLIYPAFGRRVHSFFALSLWLSVVPDIATQLYMAFGSTELFDNYFNIAHATKILAYLVPCIGLLLDYISTHERARSLQQAVTLRATELERSNADLEKFAYVASHDLKSPLRAIGNLSQFIEEDLEDVLTDDARHNMDRMRGRVARLESLLNDLLEYSRIGRKVNRQPVMVDSGELVKNVSDLFDLPKMIEIRISPDMPRVETERAPLELVFRNLIGNAIKHSDQRTRQITIDGQKTGSGFEFTVSDDGPGIDPRYHDKIFEMFQTLQPRDTREGSGMGLAVIKKLVEARGGSITVDSQAGERGTRFTFTWPGA